MEEQLDVKEEQIADDLRALGRRLEAGDDSELLVWVIPDQLACAHRPLRHNRLYGGSASNLAPDATSLVFDWVEIIQILSIKSIICLMHRDELPHYARLDLGAANLIEFYKLRGFEVCHIEWRDPRHSKTDPAMIEYKKKQVRRQALEAYDGLPKPVLLHCSAGIQRSAPVAAYIWQNRTR